MSLDLTHATKVTFTAFKHVEVYARHTDGLWTLNGSKHGGYSTKAIALAISENSTATGIEVAIEWSDYGKARTEATTDDLELHDALDNEATECMAVGDVNACWRLRGEADRAIGYVDTDSNTSDVNLYWREYNG